MTPLIATDGMPNLCGFYLFVRLAASFLQYSSSHRIQIPMTSSSGQSSLPSIFSILYSADSLRIDLICTVYPTLRYCSPAGNNSLARGGNVLPSMPLRLSS